MNRKIRFGLVWAALLCALLLACGVSALAEDSGLTVDETPTYKVKWVDEDGEKKIQTNKDIPAGSKLPSIPEKPTKEETTKEYHYTFDCWTTKDGDTVTKYSDDDLAKYTVNADVTFIAKYKESEHSWNDGEITTEATCTKPGELTYTCKKCGREKTEEISAKGHKLTKTEKVPATCESKGTKAYWTCENCKKLFSDEEGTTEIDEPEKIAKAAHTLTKTNKVDATCKSEGTKAYWTCEVCKRLFSDEEGTTEIEAPEKIGIAAHTLTKTDKVDATCKTEGTKAYWTCSVCGKKFSDEAGTTEIEAPEKIGIAAHTLTKTEEVAATCVAEGTKAYWTCSVCGKKFSDEAGTTEIEAPEKIGIAAHTLTKTEEVAATCAAGGTKAYWTCGTCGKLFSDEAGTTEIEAPEAIAKLAHTLTKTEEVAATCAAEGTKAYWTCGTCGKLFSDEAGTTEIEAPEAIATIAHTLAKTDAKDATCGEAGNNEYWTCSACGKVFADEAGSKETTVEEQTVAKLTEHTWDKGKVTTEATYEKAGVKTYSCTVCGETKTEEIPVLEPTAEPTKAPKYTITFDTKGGSSIDPITKAEGKEVTEPKAPTRKGYTFLGWDTKIPATMPSENMTITAKWIANITAVGELKGISSTYSPSMKNALKLMPQTVSVTLGDGSAATASLTWSESGTSYSKSAGDGTYTFTPDSLTTEAGNPLAKGVELPTCKLTIKPGTFTDEQATYTYRLDDANEATIIACELLDKSKTKDKKPVTELVVPEQIDKTWPVTHIDDKVFRKFTTLTSLELPKGLKTLGEKAIAECDALETLILPDSLESYGEDLLKKDDALVNLVLRTDLDSKLTSKKVVERTEKDKDGKEVKYKLELPEAVTDIIVNTNTFTIDCDFTVASGHEIDVEKKGTLKLTADNTLKNLSTIYNDGTVSNAGTIITCGGEWKGNKAEKKKDGTTVSKHVYESGVCTGCGLKEEIVVTTLDISYVGSGLTKVYDKTRNVSLRGSDFKISGTQEGHTAVRLTGLRAAYDSAECGDRKVTVSFTIGGDDAQRYRTKDITIAAKITPKELVITPTEGQKKVYGAADPSYFTGKVRGLLSGDTITGRLSREAGENVGKYKILQGTIDAGSNYKVVMAEESFEIEAKSINSTDVGLLTIGNQRYTGSAIEPDITLRFGTLLLKKDTDFKVKYSSNTEPGTAKVVLTGTGNFTGERETSFRILKISTETGTGSTGTGSSGYTPYTGSGTGRTSVTDSEDDDDDEDDDEPTYTHSGFSTGGYTEMDDDDDFFDDEDDDDDTDLDTDVDGEGDNEDDEEDDEDEESEELAPEEAGRLVVDEIDYGTILYDEKGIGMGFAAFDEEIEPGNRVLTIVPEPLTDSETGEELFLSDGVREQYGEQHLRLGTSLMQTLIDKGFTEIVYEVEQADVHIPTASLVSEIVLPEDADEGQPALEIEDEDADFVEEVEEMDIAPKTLQVAYYDVCLQQIDDNELTEREQALLEGDGDPLMAPPYRLRIRAVPVGQEEDLQQSAAANGLELDAEQALPGAGEEDAPSKPVGMKLPESCYPEGAVLMLLPTEDVQQAPEDAELIYISILDEAEDEDVSQRTPAEFTVEDDVLYASVPLTADGVYAVSAPEDSLVIGEDDGKAEEADEGEVEVEDADEIEVEDEDEIEVEDADEAEIELEDEDSL